METWQSMGVESLEAAKLLLKDKKYRSSISRAYFAAYAAATGTLAARYAEHFRHAANNPSHSQLLGLVANHLDPKRFGQETIRRLKRAMRQLHRQRIVADYSPGRTADLAAARLQLRDAVFVLDILEVI